MQVLALDTSLGATSVAVVEFPSCRVLAASQNPMERGHAEALLPAVRDVLADIPSGWAGIDRIVTTVGPGSFTGLRVALAAARAFALARKLPVVGVSTLTAFAAPVLASGTKTAVASAIDARHGSVFFEHFWNDGKIATAPALMPIAQAASALRHGRTQIVGNHASSLFRLARSLGFDCTEVEDQAAPDIAWVARLGAAADPVFAPALPLYLRPASAVPQIQAAISRV